MTQPTAPATPATPATPQASSATPVVVLDQVDFAWPDAPLFSGLQWQVPPGPALVQGGPGSGKTALLRLLAGELAPRAGQVLLQGIPVARHRAAVFWAPVEAAGSDRLTVRAWWALLAARHPAWDAALVESLAEGFALGPHLDKGFFMLSTGTRRKAWIAAGLASGAPLTLIDEPLAGLDLASARFLSQALDAVGQQGRRAVVVAHDAPLEGVRWAAHLALPERW